MKNFVKKSSSFFRQMIRQITSFARTKTSSPEDSVPRKEISKRSLKVLCIGTKSVVEVLYLFLSKEGFQQVITETNGQKGLELMSAEHPDIVFIEYQLEGMNGSEIYTAIKETIGLEQVTVISIGGPRGELWQQPSKDIIAYPYRSKELIRAIEDVLKAKLVD